MLNVISLQKALEIVTTELHGAAATETLPPDAAVGRILATDIRSREDVPAFDRSTMDGYAVIAADTFGAGQTLPAMLEIAGEVRMGQPALCALAPGQCAKIPTGGMLPAGADAVVPVEYTDEDAGGLMLCYTAVSPLQNVTRRGDDVAAGQTVLRKGTRLSPAGVGVLAAMGITQIEVYKPPKIGILSTGNEIVPIEKEPGPGEVRDVNSHLLAALAAGWGCEYKTYGILPDREDVLTAALQKAAGENDIVLVSGGSSAGEADKTAGILSALGQVYCHGIAVKPGKPTILGSIGATPVFGLPGHPAACCFMAALLVKRHVAARTGTLCAEQTVTAVLSEHVSSNHGREELLCVRLEGSKAIPVHGKSGVISLLTAADGYVVIPRDTEGYAAGTAVKVHSFQ